jgi:hypothetical protein
LTNVAFGCLAVGVSFLVLYGYWGFVLWDHFGNPLFPFHNDWFARLRGQPGAAP